MDYRKVSIGLGWFSLALGAAELLAGRRIARALDVPDHAGTVRGFGMRELASGAALLSAPGNPGRVATRVAGDALDLGALGLAARTSPGNRLIWGALGFVVAAAVLDTLVARGLRATADLPGNGPAAAVSTG